VEKYGTARQATNDNITRRMRFAYWITKATICDTYYFSTATMVIRTRLSVTLYVHCLYYCGSVKKVSYPDWSRPLESVS